MLRIFTFSIKKFSKKPLSKKVIGEMMGGDIYLRKIYNPVEHHLREC